MTRRYEIDYRMELGALGLDWDDTRYESHIQRKFTILESGYKNGMSAREQAEVTARQHPEERNCRIVNGVIIRK